MGNSYYFLIFKLVSSDAVIMAESVSLPVLNDSQTSGAGDGSNITIKVQTPNKHKMYSLAKVEVMNVFFKIEKL